VILLLDSLSFCHDVFALLAGKVRLQVSDCSRIGETTQGIVLEGQVHRMGILCHFLPPPRGVADSTAGLVFLGNNLRRASPGWLPSTHFFASEFLRPVLSLMKVVEIHPLNGSKTFPTLRNPQADLKPSNRIPLTCRTGIRDAVYGRIRLDSLVLMEENPLICTLSAGEPEDRVEPDYLALDECHAVLLE
jgi:hypothetical protein